MFLYTWFMEKLFCSNSSLVTEPWGAELVCFGWSQHRSPSLSVFSEKKIYALMFLTIPTFPLTLLPLPSSHGETVWLAHTRAGATWRHYSLMCGSEMQRPLEDHLNQLALKYSSVTGQLWKAAREVRGPSYFLLLPRDVTALALVGMCEIMWNNTCNVFGFTWNSDIYSS